MSGFISVGYFLFSLVFSFITFVLWARLFLRYFHVSALHPIAQIVNQFTDPLLKPLSNFISSKKHPGSYDWVCFGVLVIVEIIKFIALGWMFFGVSIPVLLLIWLTCVDLIVQPCNLLFYALLINVIMSWINPRWSHPIADILHIITAPLLKLGHRFIPVISGLDFTPMVMMILLKVVTIFVISSLPNHLGSLF